MLHEMSDTYDEEVHNSWEQEFLDYANALEVSQFKKDARTYFHKHNI